MRRSLWVASAVIFLAPMGAFAQQQDQSEQAQPAQKPASSQQDSLANVARKAREAKKGEPKPAKVFDNDNISALPKGISVVGEAGAAQPGGASSSVAGAKPGAEPNKPGASGDDEKKWRERFAKARQKLQQDQQELDVMQRELGDLNVQFYSDPVKGMQQSYSQAEIASKRAKIDAMQKQVQQDQQAIADLEDQLRKSGGDTGWARE